MAVKKVAIAAAVLAGLGALGYMVLGMRARQVWSESSEAGRLALARGDEREAERLFVEALEAASRSPLGTLRSTREAAISLTDIGFVHERGGRFDIARKCYEDALAAAGESRVPAPELAICHDNLARALGRTGAPEDARKHAEKAIAILEGALGKDHPHVSRPLNTLGTLDNGARRFAEAEPPLRRAIALREKALGPEHAEVATPLANLAVALEGQGKLAEAQNACLRALKIRTAMRGAESAEAAASLALLAVIAERSGRPAEAEALYRTALAAREKALGPAHPELVPLLENLARLVEAGGRADEAAALRARAKAVFVREVEAKLK